MNKVEALAALFGGKAALAEALQRHPSIVSRWCKRGKVPVHRNGDVKWEARRRGIPEPSVLILLEPACPTCGKPL